MRTSFKNFRRGYLKEHKGKGKESKSMLTHLRVYSSDHDDPEITEEEYYDAIKQLQSTF